MPQSVLLVARFWQPSVHATWPVGHVHTPDTHAAPVTHALAHMPQSVVLVARF
jgi:hypothetical protein